MKILIVSKKPVYLYVRSKFLSTKRYRYINLHYNLKIDDWNNFIEYVKNYKKKEIL